MAMLAKKVFSYAFQFACLVGLVVQLWDVSSDYTEYRTLTAIEAEVPWRFNMPRLTTCFRYVDIIDMDSYNNKTGKFSRVAPDMSFLSQGLVNATLADIFTYTPPTDNMIESCIVRYPASYDIHISNSTCNKLFSVTKVYKQEYMCYTFELTDLINASYHFRNLAQAQVYSNQMFTVYLPHEIFSETVLVKAVAHYGKVPSPSINFAPYLRRLVEGISLVYNRFGVSFSQVKIVRLEAPYKTDCRDYTKEGFRNSAECMNRCVTEACYRIFNKVPFTYMKYDPIKKLLIHPNDIRNATFSEILHKIETDCDAKCEDYDCEELFTLTRIVGEPAHFIYFIVFGPYDLSYTIVHTPQTNQGEFIILVLSCIGTWFGLSVISLNPFDFDYSKFSQINADQQLTATSRPFSEAENRRNVTMISPTGKIVLTKKTERRFERVQSLSTPDRRYQDQYYRSQY